MKKLAIFILTFLLSIGTFSQESKPVPMKKYLEFARSSADWTWENQDSLIEVWRGKIDPENVFGYRPPSRLLEMATIYATLYEIEGKKKYAERAKNVLLSYNDYKKEYPEESARKRTDYEDGVPALPDFFTTMRYIRPFDILNKKAFLNNDEKEKIENVIVESLKYLLRTQEWGAMNRSALRAETLAWAIRAIPDHPITKKLMIYEKALGADNWGQWEIEDASLYHAVWLYSLLGYADAKDNLKGLFHTPEMYYYGQYFLHLMSPEGMIPDFGDANWNSNWNRYLVFFEAAAKAYNDPELKWAASIIANKFIDFDNIQNIGLAFLFLDCYRYGTDKLISQVPKELSEEVMEDVQGKKIVFRTGWDKKSSYMLLNYRDEGDGGLLFRDYLRDAIPVEEEKMTHGHSDENSIPLFMYKGSVMLHDGGYRDYMPSGPYGAYRQDYFHNRLCVRSEKIWMGQKEGEYRYSVPDRHEIPGQSVLGFLHNSGAYRKVRTQKIDFLTFPDLDYSRTRLIDDNMGYEWDRVLAYIKDPEMIVVFDIVKSKKEEFFTASNLWHTRKIIDKGEHWYETQYDVLGNVKLNTDNNLLIYFPKNHYRLEQVENEKRHYQDEIVISETTAQHFEIGQHIAFVTVLIPHPAGENPEEYVNKIKYIASDSDGKGVSVEITAKNRTIHLGVKCDMRMDMQRDYRRPKYTYESGKIKYKYLETNGDFFYTSLKDNKLSYTVVNLTKAKYKGKIIFSQPANFFGLAFDGSSDESGIGKARYWRDEVQLKIDN
ncbi:hypothetical protein ACFLSI_01865 [Bacteroidota bacterium]